MTELQKNLATMTSRNTRTGQQMPPGISPRQRNLKIVLKLKIGQGIIELEDHEAIFD